MAATAGAFSLVTMKSGLAAMARVDEQRDRLVLGHRLERRQMCADRGRRAAAPGTPARRRRAAASGWWPRRAASGPAFSRSPSTAGRAGDLLQVVEDQEDPTRRQELDHAIGDAGLALADAEHGADGRGDEAQGRRWAPGARRRRRPGSPRSTRRRAGARAASCPCHRARSRSATGSMPAGVEPRRPRGRGRRSWSAAPAGCSASRRACAAAGTGRAGRPPRADRCAPSASRSLSRCSPRSRSVTPGGRLPSVSARVVPETRTWPPWPAAAIRAARWTSSPT